MKLTPELSPDRLGRVTASGIYALMGTPRAKGEQWTQTAITYLNKKIAERLTGVPEPSVDTIATRWGLDNEHLAIAEFERQFDVETQHAGFIKYRDSAGCTPDAKLVGHPIGIEIKCPFDSANMVAYLQLENQQDLRDEYPNHYWQIMSTLLFTGWEQYWFAAFDPRMPDKYKLKTISIVPDPAAFEAIEIKLIMAETYFNEFK
jgi:YqaJ-like viral recombinase domain